MWCIWSHPASKSQTGTPDPKYNSGWPKDPKAECLKGAAGFAHLPQGTNSCYPGPFISLGWPTLLGEPGQRIFLECSPFTAETGKVSVRELVTLHRVKPSSRCRSEGSNHSSLLEALPSVWASLAGPGASVEFWVYSPVSPHNSCQGGPLAWNQKQGNSPRPLHWWSCSLGSPKLPATALQETQKGVPSGTNSPAPLEMNGDFLGMQGAFLSKFLWSTQLMRSK